MSRSYSATFQNVSVTAQQDLFEITPADDKKVEILSVRVSQGSDMGDAQEEGLRIAIIRGHTTSGSGGTLASEEPLDPADGAAGAAVELNNTTIASAGTTAVLDEDQMNSRVGYDYTPVPEARPLVSQAETSLVVRLLTTPADALSMSGTIVWREL